MKNHRLALIFNKRILTAFLCATTFAAQATEPVMNRFWLLCDVEWNRIKSLLPLSKKEYTQWLEQKPSGGIYDGGIKDVEAGCDFMVCSTAKPQNIASAGVGGVSCL